MKLDFIRSNSAVYYSLELPREGNYTIRHAVRCLFTLAKQ
jgi:hypothetical protein